jgi:hypothetical protein
MKTDTNTTVQGHTAMHNLYYAARKSTIGCKVATFCQEVKKEDVGVGTSSTPTAYADSNTIYEQMRCKSMSIPANHDNNFGNSRTITQGVTQVSQWPNEESLDPAFITFNKGLTGYDTVEYFYDLSSDKNNPAMYMKTKSGDEENYYKLDMDSINPATATKAELLGYYSYQEYKGEDVDMYQLMADMDMAEHNGDVNTGENLQEAFLKYTSNWLKALQNVLNIQKNAGDAKGAAATQGLLDFINSK